jgi:hypothetical protein
MDLGPQPGVPAGVARGPVQLPINPAYGDQTAITWQDTNYPHALNNSNTCLHYFELSPFFDRACNNTLARQQGRDPAVPGSLEWVLDAAIRWSYIRGIQIRSTLTAGLSLLLVD